MSVNSGSDIDIGYETDMTENDADMQTKMISDLAEIFDDNDNEHPSSIHWIIRPDVPQTRSSAATGDRQWSNGRDNYNTRRRRKFYFYSQYFSLTYAVSYDYK
jgi:hypothetical protein